MKKLFLFFMVVGLVLPAGAMAGETNISDIDQIGNFNAALVVQNVVDWGDNYSNIFTVGDGNRVLVLQNSANTAMYDGDFENWSAVVQFIAFGNDAAVLQWAEDYGTNWSYINQSLMAIGNKALVLQYATDYGSNRSVILQFGFSAFNNALVAQLATDYGLNRSLIVQGPFALFSNAYVFQVADMDSGHLSLTLFGT